MERTGGLVEKNITNPLCTGFW